MANLTLNEVLLNAKSFNYAVGAFNIFNYSSTKAVVCAAEELNSVSIIQTSVSTVKHFGVNELIKMIRLLVDKAKVPILVHLDHCTDIELAKTCIESGWDSVMIDASKEPLEENIRITSQVKKYASKYNVPVEGELGIIQGVEDNINSDYSIGASYEDSIKFINETGIDAFAPAIGTAHGLYKGIPNINYDLVRQLSNSTACPVVIHGGTGLDEEVFKGLIRDGAAKINVSTALKEAYIASSTAWKGDVNPLKFDKYVETVLKDTIKEHMAMFNSVNSVINNLK